MHLNKNHTFSRRALAMLLTLTLCLSLVPSAFAAQQNSYHDPAEHWMQASNRTNELDVNSVVTRETFKCGECGKVTSFEVFRVPEYTRNGQTALSRNVKYSDGTMMDGVGKGDCMDGVPGKDAYSPIIVNEDMVIIDGHNRQALCEKHGLPYTMAVFSFENMLEGRSFDKWKTKFDVMDWYIYGAEEDCREVAALGLMETSTCRP